jgi:glycosyltransferase involved in cell wall biosynthesis
MISERTYTFLFAMFKAEGLQTASQNLRTVVDRMEGVDAHWITVEVNPARQKHLVSLAKIPPYSWSWMAQQGLIARHFVHFLEKSGRTFDAAYFNGVSLAFFLRRFRRRVPSVDGLDTTPSFLTRLGYNTPRAQGIPLVNSMRHSLVRRVYQEAVYLLPWSEFARNSLIKDYGIEEEKIHVVPPGINLGIWDGQSDNSNTITDPKKRTQILFVGGDFGRKGGSVLVSVAQREEFKNCDFHFVTRNFKGSVGDNIFVHDDLEANSKPLVNLYRNADVFVLPTRGDVYSLASLEAMAMRVPVITTGVGGIGEIVIDGENGFIVHSDSEEAIAKPLAMLLSDPELRRRMGQNGRKRVESRFDLSAYARTIVHYLQLAAERRLARKS